VSSVLPLPGTSTHARVSSPPGVVSGLRLRHAMLIALFGVLTPVTFALFGAMVGEKPEIASCVLDIFVYLGIGISSVLSARLTDQWWHASRGPVFRITAAVLGAAVLGTVLNELMNVVSASAGYDVLGRLAQKGIVGARRLAIEFVVTGHWALVLVVLYELLESSHRATEDLHAARMRALAVQQKLVEGELRAMQARVDPGLLFEALAAIDEAYAQAPARGQQRLDSLIRFLRAALPGEAAEMSTLAREQELIEAYVALSAECKPVAAKLRVSIDPAAGGERLPSMLLLSLVRWAAAFRSARRIDVKVAGAPNMLRIELEHDAGLEEAHSTEEISALRAQLAKLYAERLRLDVGRDAGRWRAVLEIPRAGPAGA